MRVSSVVIDRHDRRGIGVHAPRGDLAEDELLQAVFAKIFIIADSFSDVREGLINDLAKGSSGIAVGFVLVGVPDRFEPLHQIGRCHHLHAERTDQLDRTGVHA